MSCGLATQSLASSAPLSRCSAIAASIFTSAQRVPHPRAAAVAAAASLQLPPSRGLPAAGRRANRMASLFPRSLDSHAADGQKAVAAAAERNKEAILLALKDHLGSTQEGLVLEVASGTGQHVAHFAAGLPQLTFQPTENYADDGMASIRAWTQDLPNVLPPQQLDASQPDAWPAGAATCRAVFAANLTHISPWAATAGLIQGAGRVLAPGGQLFLYGPFSVDGRPTTESNAAFDASLRQRNPEWGYRDMADITAAAAAAGLVPMEQRDMPANNFLLVYRRQ